MVFLFLLCDVDVANKQHRKHVQHRVVRRQSCVMLQIRCRNIKFYIFSCSTADGVRVSCSYNETEWGPMLHYTFFWLPLLPFRKSFSCATGQESLWLWISLLLRSLPAGLYLLLIYISKSQVMHKSMLLARLLLLGWIQWQQHFYQIHFSFFSFPLCCWESHSLIRCYRYAYRVLSFC